MKLKLALGFKREQNAPALFVISEDVMVQAMMDKGKFSRSDAICAVQALRSALTEKVRKQA